MEGDSDTSPYQFIDEVTASVGGIEGVDLVYFLDNNFQILKESNQNGRNNYLEQVLNIINAGENLKSSNDGKPFHTYTLLNEDGLLVISKINVLDGLYIVIIGGENEPVNLIKLLKVVKQISTNVTQS